MKRKRRLKLFLIGMLVSLFGCTKEQTVKEWYDSANDTINSANQKMEWLYDVYDETNTTIQELTEKYLSIDSREVTNVDGEFLVIDKPDNDITTDDILALNFESQITVAGLFERFPKYAVEIPTSNDLYQVEGFEQLIQSLLLDKPDYIIDAKTKKTLLAASLVTIYSVDSHRGNQQKFIENPVAWPKNKKVEIPYLEGKSYHGWFYNRSHLVADSLGGPAIAYNAVTATRTQNVGGPSNDGGMRIPEELAYDFINELQSNKKEDALLYIAKPLYQPNQLIPCAIVVHFENQKHQLNRTFIVFNIANGFTLNYRNGEFMPFQ